MTIDFDRNLLIQERKINPVWPDLNLRCDVQAVFRGRIELRFHRGFRPTLLLLAVQDLFQRRTG
jgi:hypothetical protein